MKVLVNSTPAALWQNIIHEAELANSTILPMELEGYVVMLMLRYMDKPDLVREIIATQLLEGLNMSAAKRELSLQRIGDTCLLFSGLFPGIAAKRFVKLSYFINIGRDAYSTVSKTSNDIFSLLSQQFVAIMDVLQSMGQYAQHFPELLPLQAYELWTECGSKRALKVLNQYTRATPVLRREDNGACIIRLK